MRFSALTRTTSHLDIGSCDFSLQAFDDAALEAKRMGMAAQCTQHVVCSDCCVFRESSVTGTSVFSPSNLKAGIQVRMIIDYSNSHLQCKHCQLIRAKI